MPYRWVAHATIFWSIAYISGVALLAGGINSSAMVWITSATLPAVLLLSRKSVFAWLYAAIATNLTIFLLSAYGVIGSVVNIQNEVWAGPLPIG
jgi:hypothetical protein